MLELGYYLSVAHKEWQKFFIKHHSKKVTILRNFCMSTFGLFGCIPPKQGNSWYLSFIPTIRGINNLLAYGFLISIAQSEVYDQCLQ